MATEHELAPGVELIIDGHYATIRKDGELGIRHELPFDRSKPFSVTRIEAIDATHAIIHSDRVNPIGVEISGTAITVTNP